MMEQGETTPSIQTVIPAQAGIQKVCDCCTDLPMGDWVLRDFAVRGYVLEKERLKNGKE